MRNLHTRPLYQKDATRSKQKVLDIVASLSDKGRMPFATKALAAMRNRLRHECGQFLKNQKEMDELSDQYNRYVDLQKDTAIREKRILTLFSLLGKKGMMGLEKDPNIAELKEREFFLDPEFVEDLPLWKIIREYITAVGKR